MGVETPIQWCDSSVNPAMGCDGCELWNPAAGERVCYAGRIHAVRGGQKGYAPAFDRVTLFPGRMAKAAAWRDLTDTARPDKPWLDGLPRLIFVSDMADALSAAVPFDYLEAEVIEAVRSPAGRRHRWLWLSKRPGRMAAFADALGGRGVPWPANLWVGTSVTTQATVARVADLLRVGGPGTVRFLSVEPQRGPLDLSAWLPRLGWVIQGGESGRGARPFHAEWAAALLGQCRAAGLPYFLKQLGSAAYRGGQRQPLADGHGGNWSEWPLELRVREVFRPPTRDDESGVRPPAGRGRVPLC